MLLRDAVRDVNAAQNTAQAQAQAFQLGDRSVSIEQVMISMQQASISFQGMVAVRNKLLEAYREVSNLSV
jgi:flagellar hook-basal body complex protein FliE